ncbi:MAG: S-methyl-5-thioribose-1-phosphate isomerase, partial [Acidobacteria bacterium]|nr:S-methyl-5-thioribose-1-phosphate isomerase [Acidobacteriota bacterium]NIQ31946.1 S-methyl-5-thioribose-1-phosphate isomerase [Acidobacteriota bacterium]
MTEETFSPIRWTERGLELLDQTRLPREETWLHCRKPEDVAEAIYRLSVRGAPAIGVSTAYGLVVGLQSMEEGDDLRRRFAEVSELLGATRPTAVNLRWALERGRRVFDDNV